MRYVDRRRAPVPGVLISDRVRAAKAEVEAFLSLPDHERRQRRPPYDREIVRHAEVARGLDLLFHRRCAFCEVQLRASQPIDIEQFRPRAFARGSEHDTEVHYAWLAYDWENLYPVCIDCSRRKQESFPVGGRRARLFATVGEARAAEAAQLLDPCHDDPRKHLRFRAEGAYAPRSEAGAATIEIFGLNRPALVDARAKAAEQALWVLDGSDGARQEADLSRLVSADAPFPGAINQMLAQVVEQLTGRPPRWSASGIQPSRLVRLFKPFDRSAIAAAARAVSQGRLSEPELEEPMDLRWPMRAMHIDRRVMHPAPSRISIQGFKSIENLELEIPEYKEKREGAGCLMLLGENASGKSSVLEAVALTLAGVGAASKLAEPEALLRRKGGERYHLVDADTLRVGVTFHGDDAPAALSVDPLAKRFAGEARPICLVMGYGPRRYTVDGRVRWTNAPEARLKSLFKSEAAIADAKPWLAELEGDRFYAVARGLRNVLSLHGDDSLVLDDDLGICVRAHGRLTPIDRMSEGYKSLFAMAVDIMRELMFYAPDLESARAVVLIDEIETHLHPRWKLRVMSSLREAMPRVTFIVTTHDPLCLRGMEDGEVVVLHKDDQQRITKVQDLPSIKGMRAEQLLTSDYFGLISTADPNVEDKLSAYVALAGRARTGDPDAVPEARRLEQELAGTMVLGETTGDQIVQEALGRFLLERRDRPPAEQSAARDEVVDRVLAALRRPLES